jgi:tetratricopeptide (TPR) repeat protein
MTTQFHDWVAHPELLDKETLFELRTLLARYPYFQAARILYLKNLYILHDPSFGEEMQKAALFITDKRSLFYFVEGDRYTVQPQGKTSTALQAEGEGDRTLLLIDSFLAGQAEEPLQPEGTDAATASLSNDYLSYTLREEELPQQPESTDAAPMRGQELIDEFIEKADEGETFRIAAAPTETPEETPAESQNEEEEESYFTETLAKIYIKQRRYEKALEIIKKLSLKYPKKNSYFADQIRFLEKLIINSKSK